MKKIISFLIIILAVLSGLYIAADKLAGPDELFLIDKEGKEEKLITAEKGDLTFKISAAGLVQPRTKVEIVSLKRGRVNEILVEEGDKVKKGEILAWMSSEELIALVDTASAALEEAKKNQDEEGIKKAKEELEIARNTYKKMPIVAPIEGIVILRGVEPGQTASLEEPLFILADVLVVIAQVDEVDIGKVKEGQPVRVTVDAFPDKTYEGKVAKIAFESKIVDNITYYDITTDQIGRAHV